MPALQPNLALAIFVAVVGAFRLSLSSAAQIREHEVEDHEVDGLPLVLEDRRTIKPSSKGDDRET